MGQVVGQQSEFSPSHINRHLNHALTQLGSLCERLDEGEDISDLMIETFNRFKADAAKYSDHAISFDMAIDMAIDHAAKMKAYYNQRHKTLTDAKDRLRTGLLPVIQNKEESDIQVAGSLGKIIVNKGVEKARYNCLLESRSFSNTVVSDDVAKSFAIPDEYIKEITIKKVDKKKVLADLKAGKKLAFAELARDPFIQISKG